MGQDWKVGDQLGIYGCCLGQRLVVGTRMSVMQKDRGGQTRYNLKTECAYGLDCGYERKIFLS